MPSASVRDSGTAGSPAAREARRRGLNVSEMIADSLGNGSRTRCGASSSVSSCSWSGRALRGGREAREALVVAVLVLAVLLLPVVIV